MRLEEAARALEEIAPLALAETWDNVGLLLAPSSPREVRRVLLAIDATDAVVEEAARARTDLLVAYHPPLFEGAKRLRGGHAGERRIVRLLEERIAVYAPHTALDAAPGGLGDWLAEGMGAGESEPFGGAPGKPGPARLRRLARPATLAAAVARVKRLLGLPRVRLARAPSREGKSARIRTAAVCAGAGGSVLRSARADLIVTGEMRHHDVLEACARGTSVVLCDHTPTERAYLPVLARRVAEAMPGVTVAVAREDREPLRVV